MNLIAMNPYIVSLTIAGIFIIMLLVIAQKTPAHEEEPDRTSPIPEKDDKTKIREELEDAYNIIAGVRYRIEKLQPHRTYLQISQLAHAMRLIQDTHKEYKTMPDEEPEPQTDILSDIIPGMPTTDAYRTSK